MSPALSHFLLGGTSGEKAGEDLPSLAQSQFSHCPPSFPWEAAPPTPTGEVPGWERGQGSCPNAPEEWEACLSTWLWGDSGGLLLTVPSEAGSSLRLSWINEESRESE